jgi:hypothetical protein
MNHRLNVREIEDAAKIKILKFKKLRANQKGVRQRVSSEKNPSKADQKKSEYDTKR